MHIAFWIFAALVLSFGFVVFRGAPYIPSHRSEVRRAFTKLYRLKHRDVVVDVGSGDGIILRLAVEYGAARAVGYELNPLLVMISRFLSRRYKNVTIQLSDFWLTKLPDDTTVVYAFAVSRDIDKLARKVQQESNRLGRPLHFICYGSPVTIQPKLKELGGHHLYRFDPLHANKA